MASIINVCTIWKKTVHVYIYKHTNPYSRHTPETSVLLKVKSSSCFPFPFSNLPLCYAANLTDLLGSNTAYHSNLFVQTKPEHQILEGQFLALHFWKDMNQLERIRRKASGMIRGLENITHDKRLKVPRLFSLERSSWRGKNFSSFQLSKNQPCLSIFQADG